MTALEKMKDIQFPIIVVPFYGQLTPVKLRELTQAQIVASGGLKFSLIETLEDKRRSKKKPKLSEMTAYAEIQHEIAKRALVSPTYDEIFEMVGAGIDRDNIKKELDEIEIIISKTPRSPKRKALEEEFECKRIWFDLLLPEDFLAAITSYSLSINKSDIKEVTKEALLEAATLAKMGHDNPSDHYDGIFTPYMKDDFNRRAWITYAENKKKDKK